MWCLIILQTHLLQTVFKKAEHCHFKSIISFENGGGW